jgi:hypothetical protein
LQLERLVLACFSELRAPDLVRPLVLAPAEGDWRPEPQVIIMHRFKGIHKTFRIELRSGPPQRFHQHLCRDIAFQRDIIRRLAAEICKYPPAEPGALALEPLEAADGGANAAPKFWAT